MPPNVFKIHENKKKKKRHKQCLCVSLRRFRTVRYGSRAKKTRKIQIKMKNADRAWDRERESQFLCTAMEHDCFYDHIFDEWSHSRDPFGEGSNVDRCWMEAKTV